MTQANAERSRVRSKAALKAGLLSACAIIFPSVAHAQNTTVTAGTPRTSNLAMDADDTLTVEAGGSFSVNGAFAVNINGNTTGSGIVINNSGTIEAQNNANSRAINSVGDFTSRNITINNNLGGIIRGGTRNAIRITTTTDGFAAPGSAIVINNSGSIFSSGTSNSAIEIGNIGGATFSLTNSATGVIYGIQGLTSGTSSTIINNGTMYGTANAGEAILLSSEGDDTVTLGATSRTESQGTATFLNAINFTGGGNNQLNITAGATIVGRVLGSAAGTSDHLTLIGSGSGLINTTINNFETLTVSGGNWLFASPAANTFFTDGATINSGASLNMASNITLTNGQMTVDNGGTLRFVDQSVGSTSGGRLNATIVNDGVVQNDRTGVLLQDFAISGTGSLVMNGTGVWAIAAPLTNTGSTTILQGRIRTDQANVLSASSAFVLGSGAILDLNDGDVDGLGDPAPESHSQIIGSLAGDGTVRLGQVPGATLTVGGDNSDTSFGGSFTQSGDLYKIGTGVFTLTGTSNALGLLNILNGEVALNGEWAGSAQVASGATLSGMGLVGDVSLADGAVLAPGSAGSIGTLTTGDLILSAGSILNFDFAAPGTNSFPGSSDRVVVNGDLTLDGTINVNDVGGFGQGVYRIFSYSGSLTDLGLSVGSVSGGYDPALIAIQTSISGRVNLVYGTPGPDLQFWDGAGAAGDGVISGGSGSWNLLGASWTDPSGLSNAPWETGFAVFGAAPGIVTVDGDINVTGVQFLTDGYEIAAGSGTLTLANPSTSFVLGDGVSGYNATVSADLIGSGGLVKVEDGTLILTGTNSYTGGTIVRDGTLQVDGGILGPVSVEAGTLAGSGLAAGDVTVTNGAIAPGSGAVGTLTLGSLALSGGSVLNFDLGAPGIPSASDHLAITGNLTLDGTLNVTDVGGFGEGVYQLISYGGTLTDNGLAIGMVPTGVQSENLIVQTAVPNQVNLVYDLSGGVQFWDPDLALNNGVVSGGSGSWTNSNLNWTNQAGTIDNSWLGRFAVFSGAPGTVTVDDTISISGMQFTTNGYVIADGSGTLNVADAQTNIRVDPGVTATVNESIIGSGGIIKNDTGTLVLGGTNTFTGDTTIAGGTLRVVGGSAIADTGLVTVNNGATFDVAANEQIGILAGAGNVTLSGGTLSTDGGASPFSGSISGIGGLTKIGAGTLTVTGPSTYTGATRVEGGTLAGRIGTGDLFVASGATFSQNGVSNTVGALSGAGIVAIGASNLTVGGSATSTFSGSITGSGNFIKSGVGNLILDGSSSFSGTTFVNAGTLTLASTGSLPNSGTVITEAGSTLALGVNKTLGTVNGAGSIALGSFRLTLGGGTIDGAITGTGGITKTGSGTLTLNGISSYTAATTLNAGTLLVNGLITSNVNVAANARLGGTGTIGGLTLNGILAPGNGIGTLTVTGNATFNAGSVYEVGVNAAGQGDRLNVGGNVTINGGNVSVLAANGDYGLTTDYRIISSTGSVSGAFTDVTTDLAFLTPFLLYAPTSVDLRLRRNDVDYADIAQSQNQLAVATALDGAAGTELSNAILSMSGASARRAFDALSGEAYAGTTILVANDADRIRDLAAERFSSTPLQGISLWGSADIADARFNGKGGIYDAETVRFGGAVGLEFARDDSRFGVGYTYSKSTSEFAELGSDIDISTHGILAYGQGRVGQFNLRAGFSHARHDIETERQFLVQRFADRLQSSAKGKTTQLFAEVGGDFGVGAFNVEPFAGLSWQKVELGSTTETGGISRLRIGRSSLESTYVTAGIRFDSEIASFKDGTPITLEGAIAGSYNLGDRTSRRDIDFLTAGTSFSVEGLRRGQHELDVRLGASIPAFRAGTLSAGFVGNLSDVSREYGFRITASIPIGGSADDEAANIETADLRAATQKARRKARRQAAKTAAAALPPASQVQASPPQEASGATSSLEADATTADGASEVAGSASVADQQEPIEEGAIVITGIRGSLANAARKKERADQIKDIIDAEDIGKLPDTNVAEALQRITGVQINRDLGEGSEVAVRGFSANRVEINGQTQVGSGAGGGVSFQTIPSDAFSSLEVIKTPAANEIEGSLGGIIRLNTRKPLELKRPLLSVNLQAQYAERADKWTPNLSVLVGNKWSGEWGELGVLLGYTRNHRVLRQDFFEVRGWEAVDGFNRDLDGDGIAGELIERDIASGLITNLQDGAYVPGQTRLQVKRQDRLLQSYTASIQFKPGDGRLELYANGALNRNTAKDFQVQLSNQFNSALIANARGGFDIRPIYQNPAGATITPDQTVTSAILGQINANTGRPQQGVNLNLSADSNPLEQRVFTGQVGAKYRISDRTRVEIQYAHGDGRQVNDYINSTSGIGGPDRPFYFYDFATGDDIPTIIPLNRLTDGATTTALTDDNRLDLLGIGSYSLSTIAFTEQRERNRERALRVDFEHDIDAGPLRSIQFGARYATVRSQRDRDRFEQGNCSNNPCSFAGQSFLQLDELFPGLVFQQPNQDLLDGATGDFPTEYYSLNPEALRAYRDEIFQQYGFALALDRGWGFDVSQKTLAGYVKANLRFDLGSMPVFGNVGVRVVNTKQRAQGTIPSGVQGDATLADVDVRDNYTNILPSLNLVAEPFDRFYVRVGAARSMARPRPIDVAPLINISDSFDQARGGNPRLNPQVVDQVDLSLEKYYGRSNLISLAFFYKKFKERIENGIFSTCLPIGEGELESTPGIDGCLVGQDLIRVDAPVNEGRAIVKGFEIGWQQSLDFLPAPLDGFGFQANYTFVDAEGGSVSATGAVLPVQDLSRHSFNLVGYYEKNGFQARVAYNWRSKFYDERTTTNQASFAEPFGQLDASIGYDVNKNISLSVEAVNLLNAPERRYQELEERFLSHKVNDRRFLFGIRIKN